jgi:hypothetical protein
LKKNTKNLTKIIIYVWFYQIDKRMQIDQVWDQRHDKFWMILS